MTERQPARRYVLPTGAAVALVLVDAAWLGGRFGGEAATSAVDGLALAIAPIAAAVLGALLLRSWLTVMHTLAGRAGTSPAGFAVGLTYALGDVVTVVIVLSAVSHSRRLHPAPLMVAAGMVCFAVADGVFLYLATTADYRGANVIDVGWVAGYSLIALAPRLGGRQPVADAPTLARWQLLL